MDIRTARIGETYSPEELADIFHAICGGVSWPDKRPGFAVVLGLVRATLEMVRLLAEEEEGQTENRRRVRSIKNTFVFGRLIVPLSLLSLPTIRNLNIILAVYKVCYIIH